MSDYCVYCLTPKGEKYHCCQENHFIPYEDLYPEDQELIDAETATETEGDN